MALTPLRQVLNQQSSGFQSQVQQLQGFAQSIRQSQARKQQMLEKVASEKEIIQFRSDVELDQKKQYYEDVIKPKEQAERQQQQLQQYQKQIRQSRQNYEESVTEMEKFKAQSKNSGISKYGFDQFEFEPEVVTDNQGRPVGFEPKVKYAGEPLPSQGEYYDMVGDLSRFAEKLESVETSEGQRETKTIDGVLHLGNDEQAKEIINQIRTNDEARINYFAMEREGRLKIADPDPQSADASVDPDESVSQSILNEVSDDYMELKQEVGDDAEATIQFNEQGIVDDWSLGWWGEDFEEPKETINFGSSVSDVQLQLNKAASKLTPKYFEETRKGKPTDIPVDLGQFSDAEQKMILSGEPDEETLNKIPENRAEIVRRFAGYGEQTRQDLGRLFRYYNLYENVWNQNNRTGALKEKNEYRLNIQNTPADISKMGGFDQLLKPISDDTSVFEMQNAGKDYLPTQQVIE